MPYFILKGRNIVPASQFEFEEWMRDYSNRVIASTHIDISGLKPVHISTVYLGEPPEFETIIFHDPKNQDYCRRSFTMEVAIATHNLAVETVKEGREPPFDITTLARF
jgi:hypothetical protein